MKNQDIRKNSAKAIYDLAVATLGGNIEKIPAKKIAECMVSMIKYAIRIEPAYLNNQPVSYWEHKIETGEINIMT